MSELTATGVVFRVHIAQWGGKELYSFKFDGQDAWYRMGDNRYEGLIEEGFNITVLFTVDNKDQNQVEKIKVNSKDAPAPKKSVGAKKPYNGGAKGGSGNASSTLSKEEWAEKDLTIQYQSARRDAIPYVEMLIANEIVKLPAKTKVTERQAYVDGLHDLYTARFFTDTAGRTALSRADEELVATTGVDDGVEDAPEAAAQGDWDNDDSNDTGEWDG